jgi:DNA polymerase III gamma/tau subunit
MNLYISPVDNEILSSQLLHQTTHHAYLFYGAPTSTQKAAVNVFLSELIISSGLVPGERVLTRLENNLFPDITAIDTPAGDKVKIDTIREVLNFLGTDETELPFKAAVLYNAQDMTLQAQNALLKTLEEPKKGSLIILGALDRSPFLPTVLSRLTSVRLVEPEEASPLIDHSFLYERLEAILIFGDDIVLFQTAQTLSAQKTEALSYVRQLHRVFFEIVKQKKMLGRANLSYPLFSISSQISASCAERMMGIISDTLKYINQNASVQLALEVMLIRMQEEVNAENSGRPV